MKCNSQKSRVLHNLRVAVVKAVRSEESEKRLVAIDRKNLPFAKNAKDGAPSSSDDGCRNQEKRNRGLMKRIERL
jgi:hypothetical protein